MIREQFDLNGKTALVVGGRGLLGRQLCAAFAELDACVYSADIADVSKAATDASTPKDTEAATQRSVDVTDPASVDALVSGILEERGGIDILVYGVTAKPSDFYKPYTECSLEGWHTILRAELDGLFLVTQRVGAAMERSGSGSVILIGSIYGVVGNDQRIYQDANLAALYGDETDDAPKRVYSHAGYAAAKGAVVSMTRFLAAYWGEKGIRVNCVSPGGVAHPGENEAFVRRYAERTPLGRKAELGEISGAVVYLASAASSYVTGQNILVDGGWTAW